MRSESQIFAYEEEAVPEVLGLPDSDRNPVGHEDPLLDPYLGDLVGHQDVGQSGDGAEEVLAPSDDATTPGSDNCAGLHPLGSGARLAYSCSEGFPEVLLLVQAGEHPVYQVDLQVLQDHHMLGDLWVPSLDWVARGEQQVRGRSLPAWPRPG